MGRKIETISLGKPGFHPFKSAQVELDGKLIGVMGGIDPRLAKAYDLKRDVYFCELELDGLPPYRLPRYRPPSKYPSTYRDLALTVDAGVAARAVERAIARTLGDLCTGVRVFDEYRGPQVDVGRKSLAVRMILQRYDTTITDEEADAAVARVLDALSQELGATIRA